MDVVTASFLVLGAVGAGGVVLHYAGYIPKPYRMRLEATETTLARNLSELPPRIGLEVESALNRVAEAQERKYQEAAQGVTNSAKMSMVRSVGVDRAMASQVSAALSEAILGPALPVLRHFAPGLANALEENPQLVGYVIENPLFKKYIEPRLAQFMGNSQAQMTSTDTGWGT